MPEKLGGFAVHFFGDASAEGVVAVGDVAAVGQGDADQAVLAVVAVVAHQSLAGAASFADEVAKGVVVEVAITLHQQAVAVGQFAVAELAEGVVAVAQGGPALVFGDEAVLQVVFVGQRPLAVVDGGEAAEAVVGVGDFTAVGQGFDQQASGTVALVGVFQRLGVGVFGFFQQVVGLFVAGDALTFGGVLAVKVVKPQCRDIWLRRPAASHL